MSKLRDKKKAQTCCKQDWAVIGLSSSRHIGRAGHRGEVNRAVLEGLKVEIAIQYPLVLKHSSM